MHTSLASFFQNLFVDYPLVIFYNQQCHVRSNINYLCVIIISIHIILSFVYVMKNKQIDHISNIMSKRHGVFSENFAIFFPNA